MSIAVKLFNRPDGCGGFKVVACPVLICDACGTQIEDSKQGIMMFSFRSEPLGICFDDTIAPGFFIHSFCHGDFCQKYPPLEDCIWSYQWIDAALVKFEENIQHDRARAVLLMKASGDDPAHVDRGQSLN